MAPPVFSTYRHDVNLLDRDIYVSPLDFPILNQPASFAFNASAPIAVDHIRHFRFLSPNYFYLALIPQRVDFQQAPFYCLHGRFELETEVVGNVTYHRLASKVKESWKVLEASLRLLWTTIDELLKIHPVQIPTHTRTWPWPSQYGYGDRHRRRADAMVAIRRSREAFVPLLGLVAYYVGLAEGVDRWDWRALVCKDTKLHPVWVDSVADSTFCDKYTARLPMAIEGAIWLPDYGVLLHALDNNFETFIHVCWGPVEELEMFSRFTGSRRELVSETFGHFYLTEDQWNVVRAEYRRRRHAPQVLKKEEPRNETIPPAASSPVREPEDQVVGEDDFQDDFDAVPSSEPSAVLPETVVDPSLATAAIEFLDRFLDGEDEDHEPEEKEEIVPNWEYLSTIATWYGFRNVHVPNVPSLGTFLPEYITLVLGHGSGNEPSLLAEGTKKRLVRYFERDLGEVQDITQSLDFRWPVDIEATRFGEKIVYFLTPRGTPPMEVVIGVEEARTVLTVLFNKEWTTTLGTLAFNLADKGIRFKWYIRAKGPNQVPAKKPPLVPLGQRAKGYRPDKHDWQHYNYRVGKFLEGPRGPLALTYGGIVTRHAKAFIPSQSLLAGPGDSVEMYTDAIEDYRGSWYYAPTLTVEEADLICGVYEVRTGSGKQTSLSSWWVRSSSWFHSGLGVLHFWSLDAERHYRERMERLQRGQYDVRIQKAWRSSVKYKQKQLIPMVEKMEERWMAYLLAPGTGRTT